MTLQLVAWKQTKSFLVFAEMTIHTVIEAVNQTVLQWSAMEEKGVVIVFPKSAMTNKGDKKSS